MMAETDRIRVRPLIEDDLVAYQRLSALPETAAANDDAAITSRAPSLLATWFEADRHSPFAFAVLDRRHQRFIGAVLYYRHRGSTSDAYDLGYFLDPAVWGQGLMPAAIRASLSLIRRETDRPLTVWAACRPENHRSQRVLAKLGFLPQGSASADRQWFRLVVAA